jgi:hypothetical protein
MPSTGGTVRAWLPLVLLCLAAAVRADWIEQSNRHTMAVLKARAELAPEEASSYGLSEFDSGVMDLGVDVSERWQALDHRLIGQLQAAVQTEGDARVRQDLQIVITSLQNEITTLQVEDAHLLPYYNVHAMLFGGFHALLDPRTDPARYPAALERLQKYTGRTRGREPLTALARARTEARLGKETLLGPYREALLQDLQNAPRYVEGLRGIFAASGLSGWEADFALLERQLATYAAWVEQTLLPRARAESRLPPAVYANNLRNYGVALSPEELIARGQYSYQLLRSEMQALARRIAEQRDWKERDLLAVIRALKKAQIPEKDLLNVYQQRLQHIEKIIRREHLLTLPAREATIRLATEAEAAASPASFMNPPQLINNTGQYGEFVLVQTNPTLGPEALMDDWSHDGIVWALTVHEARPGHELQFATLVENGTSLARAIFAFNSANVEGWGLYAESIMQQYLPPEGQLFSLYTRLLRAARMFLDPMVNTGQMSPDAAGKFLQEQVALSRAMASSEADRYAFRAPGQATSYYYGYIGLLRLRTEVQLALGEAFDQQAFHDFILTQGLLPPDLLRQAVLEHFAP